MHPADRLITLAAALIGAQLAVMWHIRVRLNYERAFRRGLLEELGHTHGQLVRERCRANELERRRFTVAADGTTTVDEP